MQVEVPSWGLGSAIEAEDGSRQFCLSPVFVYFLAGVLVFMVSWMRSAEKGTVSGAVPATSQARLLGQDPSRSFEDPRCSRPGAVRTSTHCRWAGRSHIRIYIRI